MRAQTDAPRGRQCLPYTVFHSIVIANLRACPGCRIPASALCGNTVRTRRVRLCDHDVVCHYSSCPCPRWLRNTDRCDAGGLRLAVGSGLVGQGWCKSREMQGCKLPCDLHTSRWAKSGRRLDCRGSARRKSAVRFPASQASSFASSALHWARCAKAGLGSADDLIWLSGLFTSTSAGCVPSTRCSDVAEGA